MDNNELELSAETMRDLVRQAMDRIVEHIESLPRQPAVDVEGARELAISLVEPVPERATPFSELLDLLFQRVIPKSFNTAGPGYLAYIPGGGIFHAALADLIADAVNRYVGVWLAAPGLSQLEANVLRWFSGIVGYPREGRGVLTTGGSLANLTAVVAARKDRLPENFLSGTIYLSDQSHNSVFKAASLAGFPENNCRVIPSDGQFRIRLDALALRIEQDRNEGRTPFLIAGNAGTVNTGAVDDLEALADIAKENSLWFHVDAAYGGFFMLTERGRQAMRGIDRSDSVTLDPHKALFLPYGTGCLLVRDGSGRLLSVFRGTLARLQRPEGLAAAKNARSGAVSKEPRRKAGSRALGGGGAQKNPGYRNCGRSTTFPAGLPFRPSRSVGGRAE